LSLLCDYCHRPRSEAYVHKAGERSVRIMFSWDTPHIINGKRHGVEVARWPLFPEEVA